MSLRKNIKNMRDRKSNRNANVLHSMTNMENPESDISRSRILRGHESLFTICPACKMSQKNLFEGESLL